MEGEVDGEGDVDGEDVGLIDGNQLVEGEVDGEDVGLIDGNQEVEGVVVGQLVEGEVVGNNEREGEDDVDGEDVGLGGGQPQQPHWTFPQSTKPYATTSQTTFGTELVNELYSRSRVSIFAIRLIPEGREPVNELE